MKISRRNISALALAACLPLVPLGAAANGFPDKPVRLVMPFPAGGMGDIVARHLATDLGKLWGQPVVVDNRAGASGMIGNEHVARSAPDGYTLLLGISQLALAPSLYPRLAYDVEKDFVPLARVADAVSVFITNDPGIRSMKDYVALAKASPDKYSYGTYGAGTTAHIFAEMFSRENGIRAVHVPYKGAAPMMTDLLAGHVSLSFSDLATPLPYVQSGKVRAYAVTGSRRAPLLPDVPTFSELGYKGFDVAGWYGLFAPAKTPPEVVRRIRAGVDQVLKSPEMQARLTQLGLLPSTDTPESFEQRLRDDVAYWKKAVADNNIRIDP
ncbi:MAG TPA: tripartite tricarboxylate transporter substrate binding protein [Pseudorhodoferax sp.]|jgi:tripartite-type tricarboxylate transporter receptor subunit TctC|nr:tripartite tricarboxylate transporter substrate binding protein [Pseudorhodoferax sp.]